MNPPFNSIFSATNLLQVVNPASRFPLRKLPASIFDLSTTFSKISQGNSRFHQTSASRGIICSANTLAPFANFLCSSVHHGKFSISFRLLAQEEYYIFYHFGIGNFVGVSQSLICFIHSARSTNSS
jgi:hypothetical protein